MRNVEADKELIKTVLRRNYRTDSLHIIAVAIKEYGEEVIKSEQYYAVPNYDESFVREKWYAASRLITDNIHAYTEYLSQLEISINAEVHE